MCGLKKVKSAMVAWGGGVWGSGFVDVVLTSCCIGGGMREQGWDRSIEYFPSMYELISIRVSHGGKSPFSFGTIESIDGRNLQD